MSASAPPTGSPQWWWGKCTYYEDWDMTSLNWTLLWALPAIYAAVVCTGRQSRSEHAFLEDGQGMGDGIGELQSRRSKEDGDAFFGSRPWALLAFVGGVECAVQVLCWFLFDEADGVSVVSSA
eukprot:TRINITY_DN40253_c0_g1_i2.p2 TRINITY_DN40253_c0_g1~~TRINITY_DN40253_c0_g1_i2.p2  ORF type:complete len:123 (+),score=18.30 TRINITY_DN40253_c0_g1_i2:116-484(+)